MLRQAKLAVSLAVRNPRLIGDYARWASEGRRRRPHWPRQGHPDALTVDECLAQVATGFGTWEEGPSLTPGRGWSVDQQAPVGGGAGRAGDDVGRGDRVRRRGPAHRIPRRGRRTAR